MRIVVAYDSTYGNTELVAKEVGKALGAEADVVRVSTLRASNLSGIDLLVLGSPIIGWQPSQATMRFLQGLEQSDLAGTKAACFDTRVKLFIHGDAKDKMAKALEKSGAELVGETSCFFVKGKEGPLLEGESEKAAEWAKSVRAECERR